MEAQTGREVLTVDLNADLGETEGDIELLGVVTSASIACGAHAGDPATMRRAVIEAVVHGVSIGAHPSYPDREGFGRRELGQGARQIATDVCCQVGALQAVARLEGASVVYVKLHGALYHRAASDDEVAEAVAVALATIGPFSVLGQAGSALLRACGQIGLPVATEAFCDRAYLSDGRLADRAAPGAVLEDPAEVAARAVDIALGRGVRADDGSLVDVQADSLCVHGDTPRALEHAWRVRLGLGQAGISLAPFVAPAALGRAEPAQAARARADRPKS
jgi:UPF0271 protein